MKLWHPSIISVLAAALATLATFWATQLSREKDGARRASELKFQQEMTAKNAELALKSDEIAKLNREMFNMVTGGDGYPELQITTPGDGKFLIMMWNRTGYPLFDLSITVEDPQRRFRDMSDSPPKDIFEAQNALAAGHNYFAIGTMPKSAMRILFSPFTIPAGYDDYSLNFVISGRSRTVQNILRFKKNDKDVWEMGHSTLDISNGNILYVQDEHKLLPEAFRTKKTTRN